VVPVDKRIRVVVTAADVIHSWMVPDFGVKQDAIPGFLRDTWFRATEIGTYRGQCAELCGKDHAFMPVVVKVVSQADYDAWVAEQQQLMAAAADAATQEWTADDLIARGQQVYGIHCVACHQANGRGMPPVFPALDGDEDVVLAAMDGQIKVVLDGKAGTAMAPFRDRLSDVEIAAVITYTRNAWSNAGRGQDPVVQPTDISERR